MRYKIDPKLLQKGATAEKKEHPWATKRIAERIAGDHISEKGARAYPTRKRVSKK
jgi:hypothetical protein